LPVIVSDARPLARIVRETVSGEVFTSHDTGAFCEAVNQIYRSTISYGENGYSWVKNKYNWQQDAEKLLKLYERLKN
jgi:glycosyltransferase involved in cell wall biosynthesis